MPKPPWPSASEVLRHNLLIIVGLPSLKGGFHGRRNTSTKGLSRPTSWTLKKKVIVGSDLVSRPMKFFGRSVVLSSPICM